MGAAFVPKVGIGRKRPDLAWKCFTRDVLHFPCNSDLPPFSYRKREWKVDDVGSRPLISCKAGAAQTRFQATQICESSRGACDLGGKRPPPPPPPPSLLFCSFNDILTTLKRHRRTRGSELRRNFVSWARGREWERPLGPPIIMTTDCYFSLTSDATSLGSFDVCFNHNDQAFCNAP